MEANDEEALSFCPSFNSYSSDRCAQIVADERSRASSTTTTTSSSDFEFAFVASDEISHDGTCEFNKIFPVFNRDIELFRDDRKDDDGDDDDDDKRDNFSTMLLPLKKLFEEDQDSSSCSSSGVDELERIPEGTYCVWRPKSVELASPSTCKKSNSTGSASASKRWKLRDLFLHRRSNSDGKDSSFVFLTPKNRDQKEIEANSKESKVKKAGGKDQKKAAPTSAHEVFYVRNRATKEVDKRKSFLPYRKDLVGFFASVNGVGAGKAFPP